MDSAELLEKQVEEINKAIDLIQPWDDEGPIKLAIHRLVNVVAILKGRAYLIRRDQEQSNQITPLEEQDDEH